MALLAQGTPLTWNEIRPLREHIKRQVIEQLIHTYNVTKSLEDCPLLYGDEIEHQVFKFDHDKKNVFYSLRGSEILSALMKNKNGAGAWVFDYTDNMLESAPSRPYKGLEGLMDIEVNMNERRKQAAAEASVDEVVMTLSGFPRLGCSNFTAPPCAPTPNSGILRSMFLPDDIIYSGCGLMRCATEAIMGRRNWDRSMTTVPIFVDSRTPRPFIDAVSNNSEDKTLANATRPDHLLLDTMAFGVAISGFHVTIQCKNFTEARFLHDQITAIEGILLALSAATPATRGYLLDEDCRCDIQTALWDVRSREERGLEPLCHDEFVLPESHWSTVVCYLSDEAQPYNDLAICYDEDHLAQLMNAGLPRPVALHFSHLLVNDPVYVLKESIDQDAATETGHLDLAIKLGARSMRFKPPTHDGSIGWRFEFRSYELQLTDFEKASLEAFLVLLTRVILKENLNFLIPITKMRENHRVAHHKDAVTDEKFWFNANWHSQKRGVSSLEKMSINDIINGEGGLMNLLVQYVRDSDEMSDECKSKTLQYLTLISKRASGLVKTDARWIRDFIRSHRDYQGDSVIPEQVQYDLMVTMDKIARGEEACPELLGTVEIARL